MIKWSYWFALLRAENEDRFFPVVLHTEEHVSEIEGLQSIMDYAQKIKVELGKELFVYSFRGLTSPEDSDIVDVVFEA